MQVADTNVLVRALVRDPSAPEQSAAASAWLAAQDQVYVPQAVQLELVWILDAVIGFPRSDIVRLLEALSAHAAIHLQRPEVFSAALQALRDGADFSDGVILAEANSAGAELVTFDRKLAKRAGAKLLRT